jgi:hypothetical protein
VTTTKYVSPSSPFLIYLAWLSCSYCPKTEKQSRVRVFSVFSTDLHLLPICMRVKVYSTVLKVRITWYDVFSRFWPAPQWNTRYHLIFWPAHDALARTMEWTQSAPTQVRYGFASSPTSHPSPVGIRLDCTRSSSYATYELIVGFHGRLSSSSATSVFLTGSP